ncbi:MAG: ATP-dependent protease ATPase subunit HslU [Clostridia bacterium]|jgi:ATP-dependent HslUV protease ATP-binding subunit HslU|nr:ATP-dependent protease ATPase subunit HslU [Clostridia bacterium]MCX4366536.1 ATP-dependent protease ATPase subunit HslU [Clostridia bacterium]
MEYTPKEIVQELNRFIIGQESAKKAVAVALRNRYRRSKLSEELREEVTPKNIIMQGPTGVGKTEIARRLAKIVKAPFVKVEATKFTEVGYVGRDVESMIRDLIEVSVRLVKEEKIKEVNIKATDVAERKVLEKIMPLKKSASPDTPDAELREQALSELRNGYLDKIQIEIDLVENQRPQELIQGSGVEINIGNIFGGAFGGNKKKKRKVTVKEAMTALIDEEANKLIDNDSVNEEAVKRAENEGIIFIDEIDKIAGKGNNHGPDVSREGVQRDILPIVEGSTVNTKYGQIKTDHILFIAAGAFHVSSVSDLIPELQGRFPITVKLDSLTEKDFIDILKATDNAILTQYIELLKVENVNIKFTNEAIGLIAKFAVDENENKENIGARRLHTIMEKLLGEVMFNAGSEDYTDEVIVDSKFVEENLGASGETNLKKYIL